MARLSGKHIVVTGGTGGIGIPLCQSLIAEGAHLTVISQSKSNAFPANFIRADLSSVKGIQAITNELEDVPVDILVNLAGTQYFGFLEDQTSNQINLNYAINLIAPVLLARAVLPNMKRLEQGHIVNIGSIFGSINFAHFATYSSAKAGLKGFSEALRREVKGRGIDVTYIAPRAVKTSMNSEKVLGYAEITKMTMDNPDVVATKIVKAIIGRKKDVYIGFPESIFVRLNSLFPRLIDGALSKKDLKARDYLLNLRKGVTS